MIKCREDNGLCFRRLAKPAGELWAIVEFHDGSVYRISPISDTDVYLHMTRPEQPGCAFNFDWKKRPTYNYKKLPGFPVVPDSGWISVNL